MEKGRPIQGRERIEWIDTARGLAIFGIFMVNVPAFNAPFFLYGGGEEYFPSETSDMVRAVIDIFFQASFYTLFSLMFGFGLQMMKDRLDKKGIGYKRVLQRRLFTLFLFGVVHAFFIWHGDILFTYSILGFLLLFFMERKDRTLLGWAYGLLLSVTVPFTLMLYAARNYTGSYVNREGISGAMENYGGGSVLDIWSQNMTDWWYTNSPGNWPFLIMSMLPMMLFGMYIARKRWIHEPDRHEAVIWKWWSITGALFFVFKLGPYFIGTPAWFDLAQDNIGGSASAVFYVLSVVLVYQGGGGKWIRPLRHVGRMSLSNYIFQSVVSFLTFYSIGFGLYGEVSPLESVLFVLIIFAVQIAASYWWLTRYRYGPLEKLWRMATYGKRI